jgi:large subunit ribosomal protein L37Ae
MANQGSTGSAGRFGARYGRVARRRVSEIEDDMNDDHVCPDCGSEAVSRQGTGIWQCEKCDYKYAGGAYRPQTPGGRSVSRSIRAALGESEDGDKPDVDVDVDADIAEE